MSSDASDDKNEVLGYICVIVALRSSQLVMVSFFQWVMCIGILIVGIFTTMINGSFNDGTIYFEPFAMLGGFIWTTGNLFCVPVLQMIGLSLGPGIWGVGNMVMGWLTGTFGWFGVAADKDNVSIFWLNCIGAFLAACSVPFYAMIKSMSRKEQRERKAKKLEEKEKKKNETEMIDSKPSDTNNVEDDKKSSSEQSDKQTAPETNEHADSDDVAVDEDVKEDEEEKKKDDDESPIFALIQSLPKWLQRILGVILAVVAGALFGSAFNPAKYLQDNGKGSPEGIDYVLPHFLGIFFSSSLYFVCYIIWFRNKPFVFKQTILPGMLSGMMWGIAQVSWFIANTNLPYVVSYPLITSGPGLLSALWGIDGKTLLFFGLGTLVLIGGIVCIVVSN
ncbi:Transmembrane protein [Entamoeba marina]